MPKSSADQLRDNLNEIEDIKGQIRQAIIAKETEVPLDTPFSEYPQKIEDIQTKEDLDNVLNTQDEKIAQLEAALDNKTAGANVKLNIYAQTTEPTNKNGIWLQTDKVVEHYISDDNIFMGGTWSPTTDTASIPISFSESSAVAIGTDIYLLGGTSTTTWTRNYKYNTLTNTYTQLTNIPIYLRNGAAVVIGTNIYLFGGANNPYYSYKYDTLTNTYTKLRDMSSPFSSGAAVAVGTDIYLFGSTSSYNKIYKYNTLTNTYTQLADIPYNFQSGSAISIGTSVYLFGGANNPSKVYKYNTLTNTYTQLADIPYNFYSSAAVVIGTNVYLLGSTNSSFNHYNYKYDTLTDTYTRLTDIPYNFYSGAAVAIGTDIYLLGGANSSTTNRKYHVENKTYVQNNSVIIVQGKTYDVGYNIKLFEVTDFEEDYQPLYGFADAWFYTLQDGLITDIPTYYGNGTQWIKFKN